MITLYSCCARQDNAVPLTLTLEHTVDEVALVEAAVGPLVAPAAVFLPLVVLALEADLALHTFRRPSRADGRPSSHLRRCCPLSL